MVHILLGLLEGCGWLGIYKWLKGFIHTEGRIWFFFSKKRLAGEDAFTYLQHAHFKISAYYRVGTFMRISLLLIIQEEVNQVITSETLQATEELGDWDFSAGTLLKIIIPCVKTERLCSHFTFQVRCWNLIISVTVIGGMSFGR